MTRSPVSNRSQLPTAAVGTRPRNWHPSILPTSSDERNLPSRDLKAQCRIDDGSAKISDFGLAKNFEMAGLSGMTATGRWAGTFHFMPREQLTQFKYVQPVSDVWSIATTFYYVLTGHYPLKFSRNRDPMEVILHDEPVPLSQRDPSIPAAPAQVIDRALATDTSQRYQTAGDMRADMERAVALAT